MPVHRYNSNRFDFAVALFVLLASGITLFIGYAIPSANYFLTSSLVVVYALIGFFLSVEKKKTDARELAFIATMCAIAIISRSLFIWVPYFKPMGAIIVITAIALGARAGFLTGAVSVFVSNFVFGQGPWTPWQMVSFGILGLIFGVLADKRVFPRSALTRKQILALGISAALEYVLVSGPLLDLYALVSMISVFSPESIVAVFASGFPVNAIQASAIFIVLAVFANPLLDILGRMKAKYL